MAGNDALHRRQANAGNDGGVCQAWLCRTRRRNAPISIDEALWKSCVDYMAIEGFAWYALSQDFPRRSQAINVDAGVITHGLEQINQVLRDNVARSPRRIRAASKTALAAFEGVLSRWRSSRPLVYAECFD